MKVSKKILSKFCCKFYFSNLIIPDINESGKISGSFLKLLKSTENLNCKNKVLLYSDKISESQLQDVNLSSIDEIYVAEHSSLKNPTSEVLSKIISDLHFKNKYSNIIASSNMFGRNILPRVAGILDIEPISDVSKVISPKNFQRYIYAGNAISTVESNQTTNILTIRLTSFDNCEVKKGNATINKIELNLDGLKASTFVKNIVSTSDKPELGSAKVVISGGRALKSVENFKLLDDLASCFKGAAIGASRAAVDAGYCSNDLQVGQTGKTVAPDLYIAIGISGAIQHIAGMKDSKCIVAINTDPDAAIFNVNILT